jgi:hypothetical protein
MTSSLIYQEEEFYSKHQPEEEPTLNQSIPKDILERPSDPLGPPIEISNLNMENKTIGQKRTNLSVVQDPPSDFMVFNKSEGLPIRTLPKFYEPAVASNGSTAFYVGNHFAYRSDDAGVTWHNSGLFNTDNYTHSRVPCNRTMPISDTNCFPNNTGDNDVIYSPRIGKFIWYRQGYDGNSSLGISSDTRTWTWIYIEANNFRSEFNLNSVLQNNGLTRPSQCPDESAAPGCKVNFWWDYPQLALSNRYLYVSTNVNLGCGDGLDHPGNSQPRCARNNIAFYGSVILRARLDDLNTTGIVDRNYFQRSENNYYNCCENYLGLAQGAMHTMYWASHVTVLSRGPSNIDHEINVCKWDDSLVAIRPSCIIRDIGHNFHWTTRHEMQCPSPDNRNWCYENSSDPMSGYVYRGRVGFLWNVGADPVGTSDRHYPYPWVDAAEWPENTLFDSAFNEVRNPILYNPNYPIQIAFASPNVNGLAVMAWYGMPSPSGSGINPGPPSLLIAIQDVFSRAAQHGSRQWQVEALFPKSIGFNLPSNQVAAHNLPASGLRWGDYLRVRPYAGASDLWEGSAYYYTGDDRNPALHNLHLIFGRAVYQREYQELSSGHGVSFGTMALANLAISLFLRNYCLDHPNDPACLNPEEIVVGNITQQSFPPEPGDGNKTMITDHENITTVGNYDIDSFAKANTVFGTGNSTNVYDQLAFLLLFSKLNLKDGMNSCAILDSTITDGDKVLSDAKYYGPNTTVLPSGTLKETVIKLNDILNKGCP